MTTSGMHHDTPGVGDLQRGPGVECTTGPEDALVGTRHLEVAVVLEDRGRIGAECTP